MSVSHDVHSWYRNLYTKIWRNSSTKTSSSFQDSGKLTLAEFRKAADNLMELCPAWKWVEGTNAKDKENNKCLVLENIICPLRASSLKNTIRRETRVEEDGEEVEYLTLNHPAPTMESHSIDPEAPPEGQTNKDEIRYYDLSICYDPYYQTPQFFFSPSYRHYSSPERHNTNIRMLTSEEMLQDVNIINKNNTVTIDKHPIKFPPGVINSNHCIGIHNCKHAERMKEEIEFLRKKKLTQLAEKQVSGTSEGENHTKKRLLFPAHLSLILFLKIISTAVPTIQYDVVSCEFEVV